MLLVLLHLVLHQRVSHQAEEGDRHLCVYGTFQRKDREAVLSGDHVYRAVSSRYRACLRRFEFRPVSDDPPGYLRPGGGDPFQPGPETSRGYHCHLWNRISDICRKRIYKPCEKQRHWHDLGGEVQRVCQTEKHCVASKIGSGDRGPGKRVLSGHEERRDGDHGKCPRGGGSGDRRRLSSVRRPDSGVFSGHG